MMDEKKLLHLDFITRTLQPSIETHGVLKVGNNLNDYLTFQIAEDYVQTIKKDGSARVQKASTDTLMGRVAEEVLIYLLNAYFTHNQHNYMISFDSKDKVRNAIKIVNEKLGYEKKFDIDIVVTKEEDAKKYFLISCKGTARERIGQFISNLFLLDHHLIKEKYRDQHYLEFQKEGIQIMYGFVCYDWTAQKDFLKHSKEERILRIIDQTELHVINDDRYISGGVTVLNNFDNLEGVCNFGGFVGKIGQFLH